MAWYGMTFVLSIIWFCCVVVIVFVVDVVNVVLLLFLSWIFVVVFRAGRL